ncbi:crotonase/enoyl-CoA hydratase family protein [Nitratireductor sp. XY-223]|uniref:crotonase/enoyl-CoA hydratase family protein n=1 Tax=Nitratireductor sp. XY-223 TaxID=2561926 RepID=UPI001980CB2B|nr:crotonase/enoyl-CoA hydratase family protein [Nitratireductor sp. XY-223]
MSELDSSFFLVQRHGPVVQLSMNRPQKANGMTPDFWTELPRLLGLLDADETVRAAILTGEGKHFSGGMDLASFSTIAALFQQEPGRAAFAFRKKIMQLQDAFTAIERARFPVIAAIHGACIGGGIDMISACDMRIASSDAYFAIEEINIGMAADVGTLQRLPKLIAPAVAAELAYTGRRFDAEEALRIGLLSAVADSREQIIEQALALGDRISSKSPLAMAGIKANLTYSRDHGVVDGLDYMATWNAGMLRPEDMMNAVQAAMARKEAAFADLLAEDSLAI